MMAKRRPGHFARSLLVTGTLLVRRPQCQRRPSVLHRRRLRSEETPLFATALLAACRERAQEPSPHRSGVLTGARFDLAGLRDPGHRCACLPVPYSAPTQRRGDRLTVNTAAPPMDAAVARPGFWQRVVAFSVDSAVLSLASSFLQPIDKSGSINLLAALVYYTYFWSGAGGGRTWGMRVMGLRVVREDGSALSVTRAFIRCVGLLVSFVVLLIGVIWIAFDAKKQGWHDKFAGSLVVAHTPATFPPYPVTLSVGPNTSPQRFWAVPVLGICVKLIALIPVFVAFVFVGL